MAQAKGWGTGLRARERVVLFDLDGTICDHAHRLPLIEAKPGVPSKRADYEKYHEALAADQVIVPIAQLYVEFHALGFSMQIATGRPERYRSRSLDWFRAQGLPLPAELHMRGDKDNSEGPVIKRQIAQAIGPKKIWLAIDDDPEALLPLADLGITVLMVGQGRVSRP